MIPKDPGERVTVSSKGTVHVIEKQSGVTRVDISGKFLNKGFEKRIKELEKEFKGKQLSLGYKLKGAKHYKYYESLGQLISDLKRRYQKKIKSGQVKSDFFYDYISILASSNPDNLTKPEGEPGPRKRARRRKQK